MNTAIKSYSSLFTILLYWRVGYGCLKILLSLYLLIFSSSKGIPEVFYTLTKHELIEDPTDVFVNLLQPYFSTISKSTNLFIIFYILFWGTIDVFLSMSILKGHKWAFPTLLSVIGFFIGYEVYRVFHSHSFILTLIIMLDVFIFHIIRREYNRIKSSIPTQ